MLFIWVVLLCNHSLPIYYVFCYSRVIMYFGCIVGGSLISISSLDKRKGLKKFASKIGQYPLSKYSLVLYYLCIFCAITHFPIFHSTTPVITRFPCIFLAGNKLGKSHKKDNDFPEDQFRSEISKQTIGEADPGVISEGESDDDFNVSNSIEFFINSCTCIKIQANISYVLVMCCSWMNCLTKALGAQLI